MNERDHDIKIFFSDEKWLSKLAYLADIFDRLNILNMGLQGTSVTVFYANDRINAFKRKLVLFITQVSKNDLSPFSMLKAFVEENQLTPDEVLMSDIIAHLKALNTSFQQYFPEKNYWVKIHFQ